MQLGILGGRHRISRDDLDRIDIEMIESLSRHQPDRIFFGGFTVIEMYALRSAHSFRSIEGCLGPELVVLGPCSLEEMPHQNRNIIQTCADRMITVKESRSVSDDPLKWSQWRLDDLSQRADRIIAFLKGVTAPDYRAIHDRPGRRHRVRVINLDHVERTRGPAGQIA